MLMSENSCVYLPNYRFEKGGAADGLPTVDVPAAEIDGMGILAATVLVGLAASNGECRRHIKAGALKLNDVKVASHEQTPTQFRSSRHQVIYLA